MVKKGSILAENEAKWGQNGSKCGPNEAKKSPKWSKRVPIGPQWGNSGDTVAERTQTRTTGRHKGPHHVPYPITPGTTTLHRLHGQAGPRVYTLSHGLGRVHQASFGYSDPDKITKMVKNHHPVTPLMTPPVTPLVFPLTFLTKLTVKQWGFWQFWLLTKNSENHENWHFLTKNSENHENATFLSTPQP